ncbi:hypothetical protein J1N35_018755 [Gossypium stocksii]|uniref:Uncharacterized protein n=1 Tax=Gossypium stocksii TaxID=47602 RepID=A0A9D3VR97_9ROSI|nr:hypothetical protein J1N35_018755 [Gossypium stocksii]
MQAKLPLARIYFPYRSDVETHQVLCRNIEGNISSSGYLQGCVATSSSCVATSKAVLEFFYFAPYVATSYALCCNTATSIELKHLLVASCMLIKYISSPLGLIWPLRTATVSDSCPDKNQNCVSCPFWYNQPVRTRQDNFDERTLVLLGRT